jgi:hypothetical protein
MEIHLIPTLHKGRCVPKNTRQTLRSGIYPEPLWLRRELSWRKTPGEGPAFFLRIVPRRTVQHPCCQMPPIGAGMPDGAPPGFLISDQGRFLHCAVAGAPAPVGMTRVFSGAQLAADGIRSPSIRGLSTVPPSLCHSFSFAPSGACLFSLSPPTACAVGCNLSPLRGWERQDVTRRWKRRGIFDVPDRTGMREPFVHLARTREGWGSWERMNDQRTAGSSAAPSLALRLRSE